MIRTLLYSCSCVTVLHSKNQIHSTGTLNYQEVIISGLVQLIVRNIILLYALTVVWMGTRVRLFSVHSLKITVIHEI